MNFFPVIDRELRIQARKPSTYRFRVTAATLGFAGGFLTLLTASAGSTPESTGKFFFWLIGIVAFGLVLIDALRTTSDCISEERREGTLALLLLTDLRSMQIVLGKYVGATLNSYYALAAILPLFSIPLLLGGVTLGEVARLILTLVSSLTLAASIGLFVSSMGRRTLHCWFYTALLVLAVCGLPALLIPTAMKAPALTPLVWLSPIHALTQLGDNTFSLPGSTYWHSIVACWIWSLLALGLACVTVLRRDAPHQHHRGSTPTGIDLLDQPILKSTPRVSSKRWLADNPYYWLGRWHNLGQHWIWVAVGGMVLFSIVSLLLLHDSSEASVAMIAAIVLTHFGLSFWQTLVSVRLGHEFKKSGAAELAIITPIPPQKIVTGLISGIRYPCLPAAITLYLCEMLLLGFSTTFQSSQSLAGEIFLIAVLAISMVASIMEIIGSAWMGFYQGLRQPKMSTALARSIFWTQITTLLTLCCCFGLGPFISLVKTLIVAAWARDTLLFTFPKLIRQTAGYEAPPTLFQPTSAAPPVLPSIQKPAPGRPPPR